MKDALKRVGRTVLWPFSRFFDPRFAGVMGAVGQVSASNVESTQLLGRSLEEIQAATEELLHVASATRNLAERASSAYYARLAEGSVSPTDLDAGVAGLLNYAESHRGFAAQSRLWFNPPLSLAYEAGGVALVDVNERLAEVPFAFRSLAGLATGARVLDVGATESTTALSLASLGYDVTAIDIRPYPLSHPRLRAVVSPVEEWESERSFDAVLCVSTIEHIGLAAYGGTRKEGADLAAMRRLHELTVPGGLLVLTTRLGDEPSEDAFQRTYDRAGLEALVAGWDVDELLVVRRDDSTTWTVADGESGGAEAVALVRAIRR